MPTASTRLSSIRASACFRGRSTTRELAAATCRAYNRWLADYCKPYPDRLFGVAMLPMQSVELAIAEMRFARKELGFTRRLPAAEPLQHQMIHDPDLRAVLGAAEELDFSIGFHEGAAAGMPQVGIDRFEGPRRAAHHHPHDGDDAGLPRMIWGGVCERHPKIRVGFLESGGGWIAPWLDRMDRHFDDQGFNDCGLKTRPSESSGAIAGSRSSRSRAASRCSPTMSGRTRSCGRPTIRIRTGSSPARPAMVRKQLEGLSAETQHQVMAGGAMGFYGLN